MSNFYNQASWLLIPSGIKEDVVFAQKPTSGLGDLTFTRASDATYTDSTGVVRRSPYNLVTFSEMFSDVAWTKTNATITANTTTAPNGTLTADKVTPNTTSGNHIISQAISGFLSGIGYTFSYYAKPDGYTKSAIRIGGTGYATVPRAEINLATGAIIYQQGFSNLSVTSAANGYYRISGTFVSATGLTPNIQPLSDSYTVVTDNYVYAGDGTSGIIVWGAQLVEGTSALDYFPTTNRQDVPRIDFRNSDGTLSSCGRLLLEPQRTNLVRYSEQFDNAAWTKQNTSVTANSATSPDGYQNADLIVPANGVDGIVFFSGLSFTSGTTYTLSAFGKKEDFDFLLLAFPSSAFPASNRVALFDLNNGTIASATQSSTGAIITDYGNGWYRCSISIAATTTTTGNIVYGARSSNNLTSLGNGTDGVYIWGAQVEAGAYATSYIPTTTAAVTRIADVASKTGVSSLIGQTEGTALLDFQFNGATESIIMDISASGLSPQNRIILYQPSGQIVQFIVLNNSVSQVSIASSSYSIGQRLKVAIAYKANDFAFYINGVQIGTDNSGTVPATSRVDIGNRQDAGFPAPISVNQAALFPTRLTNATLAQLTTL